MHGGSGNFAYQPGMQQGPQMNSSFQQSNPSSAFLGAGSDILRTGLGVYGEKFLGSSSEFMHTKITKHLLNPQYYFLVNEQYVQNKLKVILLPFLHRGHWTRISEPVAGQLAYKPPVYDINAPDLYIPFMAFATFIVLAGYSLGVAGRFSPDALSWQLVKGLIGWGLQIAMIKGLLHQIGGGSGGGGVPLLDVAAYGGYLFVGLCLAVASCLLWRPAFYFVLAYSSACMGIFLVNTMRRAVIARRGSKQNSLLLLMAAAQFPLFFFLSRIR